MVRNVAYELRRMAEEEKRKEEVLEVLGEDLKKLDRRLRLKYAKGGNLRVEVVKGAMDVKVVYEIRDIGLETELVKWNTEYLSYDLVEEIVKIIGFTPTHRSAS